MSVTPQDFLKSAEDLAATDASEVYQRNAISRAYYAAYHRSKEYIAPDGRGRECTEPGGKLKKLGMHRSYLEQLMEYDPGTPARRLGVSLGVIYSGRIRADYALDEDVLPREFPMHLNRAKDIFELIDTTPHKPQPERISPKLQVIK